MSTIALTPSATKTNQTWFAKLARLLRAFPMQARLALGTRGVVWATVAGIVGLLSCAVSLTQIALSIHGPEGEYLRQKPLEIIRLDESGRKLMRTLHLAGLGKLQSVEAKSRLVQAWSRFQADLEDVCDGLDGGAELDLHSLRAVCAAGTGMRDLLAAEIDAFAPPQRPIAPEVLAEVMALVGQFTDARMTLSSETMSLIARMTGDYEKSLLVLTLSTSGFVASGLVLAALVGWASMHYHERWLEAHAARDLLQETVDTLPAGVVVYDQQERLMMFNSAAVASTPILKRPGIIGITYEELARETAKLAQEFGAPLQNTAEEWIERFRSKGGRRMRQLVGARWFEWYEKLTPSGRTVGLRVDVTDMKVRELELEHARTQYQALVDSLSDVAYALDVKGKFVFASAATQDLLGVGAEQLVGRRFIDFVVPDQIEEVISRGRAHYEAADNAVRQASLQMICADGTVRHVEARYRKPAGGVSEEVVQVGVLRDVSERVALTEQLRRQVAEVERSRADYQFLVDSLGDLVLKIEGESAVITFASAASQELLGIPPSRLIGTNAYDLVVEDDRAIRRSTIQPGLKRSDGKVLQACYRIRTAGDEEHHVEARYRKMRGSDGRTVVVAVVRDVEEQYQLSRRLKTETARLRSIVESSGAMIMLIDRELKVVMVNDEFTSITGVAEADALGRPVKEVIDCPLDEALLSHWLSGRHSRGHVKPVHFTKSIVDRLGNQRFCAATASASLDKDGRVSHIVLLGVDDTERHMAEQALYDAERLAIVGEMAATLAHEINQPLQVISIACASAEDELAASAEGGIAPSGDFLRGKVTRILQQIDRSRHIVDELRSFVRGTASEVPAPFDPASALRGAVDLTKHGLRQSGVAIAMRPVELLPPVVGHVGKLEQVLINLINNARDAGSTEVEISAAKRSREGLDMVLIAVDDNGPGIAADVLPRLFNSFVTTKPRGVGTGLGLRICRRIVEEMGGTITATNRPHGGASFEVLLPAACEPDVEAAI